MSRISQANCYHYPKIPHPTFHLLNQMKFFNISRTFSVVAYYFSIFCGVCPFIYDRKSQSVRSSNLRSIYSLTIHGSCLMFVLPLIMIASERKEMNNIVLKDFSLIIDVVNLEITTICAALSLIVFYTNRGTFMNLINDILRLNTIKFKPVDKQGEKIDSWLLKTTAFKWFLSGFLNWTHIAIFNQNFTLKSWVVFGLFFCRCSIFTLTQFSNFYFCTAVGFLCKFYETQNSRLNDLYRNYKLLVVVRRYKINGGTFFESCGQLSDQIDEISALYGELYKLHELLKTIYEIQVISGMVSTFLSNVSYCFASYTLINAATVNWVAFFTYGIITAGLVLDGYLASGVCERNCILWMEARDLLGKFCILESMDCRLDQSVSWF